MSPFCHGSGSSGVFLSKELTGMVWNGRNVTRHLKLYIPAIKTYCSENLFWKVFTFFFLNLNVKKHTLEKQEEKFSLCLKDFTCSITQIITVTFIVKDKH